MEMIKKMFGIHLVPSIGCEVCYFSTSHNELRTASWKGITTHFPDKLAPSWMLEWLITLYLHFLQLANTTDV